MKTITFLALGSLFLSSFNGTAQSQAEADSIIIKEGVEAVKIVGDRYFYLPNMLAYFDRQNGLYIIRQNDVWVTSETIDFNSMGYCVRNGFRVALAGYTGEEPYTLLAQHKLQYPADYSSKKRKMKVVASLN
jgi:hypothetical protein